MFVLEDEGKLQPGDAIGRARATKPNFHNLPQHVSHGKKKAPAKKGMPASLKALSHVGKSPSDNDGDEGGYPN